MTEYPADELLHALSKPCVDAPTHEQYIAGDTEHERDEPMAREIVSTLHAHYPGHKWFVLIRGGVVQIKKLEWSFEWGMMIPYADLQNDANARKRDVVRAAGEFLERGHAKRGANTGERLKMIEGIPEKHSRRMGL